jgi:hypothetical protein
LLLSASRDHTGRHLARLAVINHQRRAHITSITNRARREGKGREGKGREGKGREGKGREGKGREGKGREGTFLAVISSRAAVFTRAAGALRDLGCLVTL